VRPGYDAQAAVRFACIVEKDQRGDEIGVGVRIVGEVLVPFDDTADFRSLHVELAVVEQHVLANQPFDAVEQARGSRHVLECGMLLRRRPDPAHGCAVLGFEFIRLLGIGGRQQRVDRGERANNLVGIEEFFDHEITMFRIERQLLVGKHDNSPLGSDRLQ
jgi:hypothetical protein